MLRELLIKNFQSHKKTKIEFGPGVNVIVGPSNSGKSAIVRALRWLLFNQPTGDAFRSHWGGNTEVHGDFDNGQVARIRDKKFNGYVLGMHDEFKGFGRGVPEPIQEFLNISELNMQNQLDSPFILSMSPGERGQYINDIANLEIIDQTISKNKKMISSDKTQIKVLEVSIKEKEQELLQYNNLEQMEDDVSKLEKMQERTKSLDSRIEEIEYLIDEIDRYEEILSHYTPILDAAEDINNLHKSLKSMVTLEENINDLSRTLSLIKSIDDKKQKSEKEEKRLIKELKEATPDICPLCNQRIPKNVQIEA